MLFFVPVYYILLSSADQSDIRFSMTIQQIYKLAVEMGIKADPRGTAAVKRFLAKREEEYKELSEKKSAKKKKLFDLESLKNPYSDTRILFGDPAAEVDKVMAGIDAGAAEVILVDRLNEKGEGIDLLISHHPSGHALAGLHEVMDLQVDIYEKAGVPGNVAHSLFDSRIQRVKRGISPLNHSQAVDAARLLSVPIMAIHTVWDNLGNYFLKKYLSKKQFDTAGDVLEYISEIPEFIESAKGKAGPYLAAGNASRKAGKIVSSFTGGTNPSKELYMELAKAGVGTIVEMHVPEEAVEELGKLHVNVIDTGHMAADSIGANIFLDELERLGITVIPSSGLIRVKRKEKIL
jgi:putative NIF3 family GTP cyclohydrolase 1 type 2